MEHLFFQPDEDDTEGTKSAFANETLSTDWSKCPAPFNFVSPKTLWLGFAHDKVPRVINLPDYPASTGWNTDHIWNGHLKDSHANLAALDSASVGRQVASFLQSWLYFGALEAVLCKSVEVSYLTRRDVDDNTYLYTQNLHYCLQARVFHIRIKEYKRKPAVQKEMGKQLFLARDWLMRLCAFGMGGFKENLDRNYPGFMDLIADMTPAIVRLIEAVKETMMHVFQDWPMESLANLHVPFAAVELRRARLKQSGWCNFQIRMLEATTNQSTIDWIANTWLQQDTPGHERCTEMACDRNNVDVSTYQQQHCTSNCSCSPLHLNQPQVEHILQQDMLPVIHVQYDNGDPKIIVEARRKDQVGDYVAISHVWVDGLGGSTEKGLLRCQVDRIFGLVQDVPGTQSGVVIRFWIDSLCIPPHSSNYWLAAVIGIREVYTCAKLVLVIDRLVQRCLPEATAEEIFASIYLSAWMQRMWTYEEAVLARRLVFLIGKDNFFDLEPTKTPASMRPTVSIVWSTLAAQLNRLRRTNSVLVIGHVYLAFRFRLTNAKGDEFLSVASLLQYTPSQLKGLENVKGDERAKEFWLMLRDIPANAVFTEGPKVSFPGFRWAPRTMMFPTETRLDTEAGSRTSRCTMNGLFGDYLYLRLDRSLHGCNKYPHKRLLDRVLVGDHQTRNQNFMIWVKNDAATAHDTADKKGMGFRFYCDETWPAPPDSVEFDSFIILTVDNTIPSPGQFWPAVALLRNKASSSIEPADGNEASIVCEYIGRGMAERLRMEEFAHSTPTIMHTGANYTVVEAFGRLEVSDLCIT